MTKRTNHPATSGLRRVLHAIRQHPLIDNLVSLRGNPRACVYTEPLWGIPHALYFPYMSVYMLALGVGDVSIGLLLTIGMVLQVVSAFLGSFITDRLGRRRTTFLFDFVSWSAPVFVWMIAQNFAFFLVATILNSTWQITSISWSCLMTEDAREDQLVGMYTWCTIAGLLAVFVAPISAWLVETRGLVPAMRMMLLFALISMSTKFIVLHIFSEETEVGRQRMAETKGQPLRAQLVEYIPVIRQMAASRPLRSMLLLMVLINATMSITSSFYSLYVTQDLGIADQWLAYFPMLRSIIMLVFIFTVQTMLNRLHYRIPMSVGFVLFSLSQVLLLVSPPRQLVTLFLYVAFEAFGHALVIPHRDSLLARVVDPHERSRMYSVIYITVIFLTSPFGYIAGQLSNLDRRLPFALNTILYLLALLLIQRVRLLESDVSGSEPKLSEPGTEA
ncbi:MAG: MFS transporter [Bacillota bacterium]|nr:MFS transporter [Bacillota bacterium]